MNRVVSNLKSLSIDMINKAGSGHPGICLSAAPIIYTLYAKHIHVNPKDIMWPNRDRFILSAGHGSALLYACQYMTGFLSLNDLKQFRQLVSRTPGHPEYLKTPGVEATTGPLGQGIGMAVGMAIGGKNQQAANPLFNYYIYVLCGDGDLMEGISYEACSIAGTLKLDNLIILYDSNNMTLDGSTNNSFTESVTKRFEAMGWYTTIVSGDSINAIDNAISKAKKSGLPSLIEIKTILGKGSLLENTNYIHGKPLTEQDIKQLRKKLGIPNKDFFVDHEAMCSFRNEINLRSEKKYKEWKKEYKKSIIKPVKITELTEQITISKESKMIEDNNIVMNYLANIDSSLIGGSADLNASIKTYLDNKGDFSKENYLGKNIHFGVREHAAGAIINGLALIGYKAFCSTFLSFSDYLKPAIRMSSLMNLPVTYIFSHDSISIGFDGPTHQPIEQLSALRGIPNLTVYRPADFNEVVGCWQDIIEKKSPSALVLSKEITPNYKETSAHNVRKGAYIVQKEAKKLDLVLIASGTEVTTCINIANSIKNFEIRVVSMPSTENFLKMSKKYQRQIIPATSTRIAVEASNSLDLLRFVNSDKHLILLNDFGQSGTKNDVLRHMNFTEEQIKKRILDLLK